MQAVLPTSHYFYFSWFVKLELIVYCVQKQVSMRKFSSLSYRRFLLVFLNWYTTHIKPKHKWSGILNPMLLIGFRNFEKTFKTFWVFTNLSVTPWQSLLHPSISISSSRWLVGYPTEEGSHSFENTFRENSVRTQYPYNFSFKNFE